MTGRFVGIQRWTTTPVEVEEMSEVVVVDVQTPTHGTFEYCKAVQDRHVKYNLVPVPSSIGLL